MISREDMGEYLADSGLSEKDLRAIFLDLGIDYESSEFDEDIVEKVETAAKELGFAVDKVKKLSAAKPAPVSSEIVAQQVGAMVFTSLEEQGISLSMETIAALAQARVEDAIELADKLSAVEERAFAARLTHRRTEFVNRLLSLSNQSAENIDAILGDEAQKEWIAASTPQAQLNGEVQQFLGVLDSRRKARKQITAQEEQAIAQLPSQDPKAFVRQFLAARREG